MSLNNTPSGERIHIGFFGTRNAGKSSLINAVTGQELSVVSEVKGTTTDPVTKAMELLPLGPVVMMDTPGFDDEGELGQKRVLRTRQVINKSDIAILVLSTEECFDQTHEELIHLFEQKKIPYLVCVNKCDLEQNQLEDCINTVKKHAQNAQAILSVSAKDQTGIYELKEALGKCNQYLQNDKHLVADLLKPGDLVVLVVPIDSAAPKGRLILPQQQMIRDALEIGAIPVVCRETELTETLNSLQRKPALVITDSQAFEQVSKDTPEDILLTSFSILMARYKGFLGTALKGVKQIDQLQNGDRILISEGCTHHRQCEDIGTVKIPNWLKKYTGKELIIETSQGNGFPEDLSPYAMVIHCGGCMLSEREVLYRMKCAEDAGIPFTNYGTTIAYMKGILERSILAIGDLS